MSEAKILTWMDWADSASYRGERTVYGAPSKGLQYEYSDRLPLDRWQEAKRKASSEADPETPTWFECALKYLYGRTVCLKHVLLGLSVQHGSPYLVFGVEFET